MAAQAVQVYEGEPILLRGKHFSDQLALWCVADDGEKAQSTVINTTMLSCPAALLRGDRGLGPPARRTLQIYSESLLELISPGLNPRISAERVPLPHVTEISRDVWPANLPTGESLNLTMSGQVLERQVKVRYGDSGPYDCQIEVGFSLRCPPPGE